MHLEKEQCRRLLKKRLKEVRPETHQQASSWFWTTLCARMSRLNEELEARGGRSRPVLFGFAAMSSEPDWFQCWAEGVKKGHDWGFDLALPVARREHPLPFYRLEHPDEVLVGTFNIREPNPDTSLRIFPEMDPQGNVPTAAIAVPGLGFGKNGERLGRGAGYYDRFLESIPAAIPKWGICYAFQILDNLPCEAHDQRVNELIIYDHIQ